MFGFSRWSVAGVTLLTVGLSAGAIAPFMLTVNSPVAVAQTNGEPFPDIQDHWAQPFIRTLANEGIVEGYLDGTYRPEQAVNRDEFAALVNQAFEQENIREIESGSAYRDIPEGYWAEGAIEAAYQQGFMTGYPGGVFRPNQPISKVEALTSLARNLNLPGAAGTTEQAVAAPAPTEPTTTEQPAAQPAETQPATRQVAKTPLLFPLAMTALMQPVLSLPQQDNEPETAASPGEPQQEAPSEPIAATQPEQPEQAPQTLENPASYLIDDYYVDADQIPQYAVGDVAAATEAGIVVNHPEPNVLAPNQPVSRGEMAAILHQALVYQDRLAPLPEEEAATNYIVGRGR